MQGVLNGSSQQDDVEMGIGLVPFKGKASKTRNEKGVTPTPFTDGIFPKNEQEKKERKGFLSLS